MKRDPKNSRRPNDGAANLAMLKRTVKKPISNGSRSGLLTITRLGFSPAKSSPTLNASKPPSAFSAIFSIRRMISG